MKRLKPAVGLAAAFLAAGFLWMDVGGVEPRAVGRGAAFAAAQDTAGGAVIQGKGLGQGCRRADGTGTRSGRRRGGEERKTRWAPYP